MTLPFQQTWPERMGELAGQPNYFVEKIILALEDACLTYESYPLIKAYSEISEKDFFGICVSMYECNLEPKLHTIREDKSNRWKAGNDIHFVINNRTKNRFQFAPVIKCVSVQRIRIVYENKCSDYPSVVIDGRPLFVFHEEDKKVIRDLALNDGFPSVKAFFQYFSEDFTGKIIHWTDLKY